MIKNKIAFIKSRKETEYIIEDVLGLDLSTVKIVQSSNTTAAYFKDELNDNSLNLLRLTYWGEYFMY